MRRTKTRTLNSNHPPDVYPLQVCLFGHLWAVLSFGRSVVRSPLCMYWPANGTNIYANTGLNHSRLILWKVITENTSTVVETWRANAMMKNNSISSLWNKSVDKSNVWWNDHALQMIKGSNAQRCPQKRYWHKVHEFLTRLGACCLMLGISQRPMNISISVYISQRHTFNVCSTDNEWMCLWTEKINTYLHVHIHIFKDLYT